MKKRLLPVLVLSLAALMMLHFAGRGLSFADTPEPPSPQSGTEPAGAPSAPAPTDMLEGVILTRAPEPTATPGRVEQQVDELAETVGLARDDSFWAAALSTGSTWPSPYCMCWPATWWARG